MFICLWKIGPQFNKNLLVFGWELEEMPLEGHRRNNVNDSGLILENKTNIHLKIYIYAS